MSPCKSSLSRMSLHLGCHFKGSNAFLNTFGGILKEPNYLKPPRRWVSTHNWLHSLPGSVGAFQNSIINSSRALGTYEPLPWIEGYEDKGQEKLADRQLGKTRGSSAWNVASDKYFSKQNRTRPDYTWKPSDEGDNEGKKGIRNPYTEENEEEVSDSEPANDVRWDGIQKNDEKIVEIDERKRTRRSVEDSPKAKTYEGRSSWDNQEDWGRRMWREVTSSSPPKMIGEAVYGVGPVMAALTICRREFYALYVQEGLDLSNRNKKKKDKEGIGRVLQMAGKLGLAVKETSKHDLNMLVDSRPHQGLVLDASPLEMVSIKELEPVSKHTGKNYLWVALDEVTDPQNFGAVVRSAYFFGAAGVVVCAKNSAPLSGVVSKASAGSLEVIDLRSCRNMMQFLELSASNGWRVLGASASAEALPLNEVSPGVPTILVLGSEGRGLRPLVKRSCSQLVGIPGTLPPIIMKSPDTCFGKEQTQSEDAEVRQSSTQPPCHLSMFLEVTDPRNNSPDWSCFVSHRLSVVNQRSEERSVTKESQNRYSKAAKDWGWREFVTLTSLFDQDSGFLVQDTVVFSAEVLILKETSIMQEYTDYEVDSNPSGSEVGRGVNRGIFTWKVENFLAFKEIMETRKIFSKFFQAGGCELRIGLYESFDTLCIYLESDQSVGTDPDKNFWVRYRMAVVNQKRSDRTVWKESSICTKTWNNSVLQFMKVSDMMDPDAGFLARDTVVFVCEILDCCPWFEFSDLEVMVSYDEQDALSTDSDELIGSDESEVISGDEEDIFRSLLARAGFHLTYGDNPPLLLDPSQLQITLREKLLMDAGAIAAFLTGLRVYLDDPAKVKRLLLPTKLSSSIGGKKSGNKGDTSSPSLMNLLMGVKVLQQAIVDLLLDIMVECCQPSEGKRNTDTSDARSKSVLDDNGTANSRTNVELQGTAGTLGPVQSPVDQRLDVSVDVLGMQAVQSSDSLATESGGKAAVLPASLPPESGAQYPSPVNNANQVLKPKWPEQSDELLGLIVNSLRALDGAVPQGCPEPRRRPQSAQKIALVLDKSPKHLQPDIIALVPKLVDFSEHSLAAYVLLARLQKPDAEPTLQLPVLGALSQMEVGNDIWEQILYEALEMLPVLNDERLAAVMGFTFKAASECQQIPQAARAVRGRLKKLGADVSPQVLDVLRTTVVSRADVAEALLREIDSDGECSENDFTKATHNALVGDRESGDAAEQLHLTAENSVNACWRVADVYILVEMLSIPSLKVESQRVFERAVVRGAFGERSVVMVLERRRSQRLIMDSRCSDDASQSQESLMTGTISHSPPEEDDDFPAMLGLAEELTLSRETRVREFVSTLYAVMFKVYGNEGYRERMLRGLVERATSSSTNGCHEMDVGIDILTFLVREEEGTARPVLSMIRDVAELANVDRATLWQQLHAAEEEIIRAREDRQNEITTLSREKATLSQRLADAGAAQARLKSEMKAELDRFSREKRDLSERIQEADNQLEWIRSEHAEEIAKFAADKKVLQDRLREAETQLTQLKSRKRDELKRVVKEKNALAERLKNAEAARKRFDEELKRFATETVSREEVRRSLEDQVWELTQTVGKTEGGLREKEEQIVRCEAYIDGMEAKLHACQNYIQTLEASLQEEMSRHAPLYGAGLEALSMSELDTLVRIHEEGLRQVHAIQQQRNGGSDMLVMNLDPLVSHAPVPPPLSLYGTPPPMAVGMPSIIVNGAGIQNNGHLNGTVGPWFSPS